MAADNQRPPEERFGQAWDAFLAGRSSVPDDRDAEAVDAIERLYVADDAPPLDEALAARIWRDAAKQSGLAMTSVLKPAGAISPNGHHAFAPVLPAKSRLSWNHSISGRLSGFVRMIAIGALAGLIAGVFGAGVTARIAMRIVALMADPSQQGTLTDNESTVGVITFNGTLFLLALAGVIGIGGGLIYVAIRPWLPATGIRRGALFGTLALLTSGSVLMTPSNPDYERFGVPGVNICLFSLIYIVFGLMVVPLADWLDRAIPATWPTRSRRLPVLAGSALLIVCAAPVVPFGVGLMLSPVGLAVSALILGSRILVTRWIGRFERPTDLLTRPQAAFAAYAALALPVLIGTALTLRAIGEILGVG